MPMMVHQGGNQPDVLGPRLLGPGKSFSHRRHFEMSRGNGPWWTPLPRCHYAGSIHRLPLGTPLDEELGFLPAAFPLYAVFFIVKCLFVMPLAGIPDCDTPGAPARIKE